MSVTKLKLMSISGSTREMTSVLYMCVNDPYLHIEDAWNIYHDIAIHAISEPAEQNPYKELSLNIESLASSAGIDLAGKLKTFDKIDKYVSGSGKDPIKLIEQTLDLNDDEAKFIIKNQIDKLKSKSDEITSQNQTIIENMRVLEQLDHIGGISANLDALFKFEFFKFRFGHMPREAFDSISMYGMADADEVFFIPSSIERNEVWGIYFTPRTKSIKVDSLFSVLHFERVRISDKAHGTPETARTELSNEIENIKNKIAGLTAELNSLIAETSEIIDKYYEKIYMLSNVYELKKKIVRSNSSFHLITWLPENHVSKFSKQLEKLSTVVSPINSPSDMPTLRPPTLLKNFLVFRPFEQFVKMYGLPSYNEIDPTPFLALTYILFFGIMFADLGQGLIISAAGFLLWGLKRINLGRIAGILGLSSAVFGVLFGSVFGMEDIISGYNPLEHINTVLISAIGLGIFTVSAAIIINIINGIKQKNLEKIFFSQNGLAGLIFYWAVIIAALSVLKYLPLSSAVPVLIGFVVLCVAIMYLREPLANILTRKSKIIPHNPIEYFIVGLFEMFEIVLSFLTNTVSFIRVGAFALNHVGMMSVVMLLAENTAGGKNPVVIVVGNIIVIALEGLIVGIQCLRLEYYEIFGRFFDGNGRIFESSELSLKKYNNIK